MYSLITLCCLFWIVTLPAVLSIIAYPLCRKWRESISNYIVKTLVPEIFVILNCYRRFHFYGYRESKKNLPEQFMILSNHQSLLDIPAFMNFFKEKELRFVAKDILARHIPLVSEMLRTQQHCMIPRTGNPMIAMKTIEDFGRRVLEKKQIPVLFPEGTRTRDGNVGNFYSAGFRKLTESVRLPVVACALDGGYQIRDMRNIMTKLKNGCYRIKVVKVFPAPQTKDEEIKILEESRVLIQQQLDEWRALSSKQW